LEESGLGLILRYSHGIRLDGLRKTTKNLNQDSRFAGRGLNPGPPEYAAGVLNQSKIIQQKVREILATAWLRSKSTQ
jgi:hypothetical protein